MTELHSLPVAAVYDRRFRCRRRFGGHRPPLPLRLPRLTPVSKLPRFRSRFFLGPHWAALPADQSGLFFFVATPDRRNFVRQGGELFDQTVNGARAARLDRFQERDLEIDF